MLAPAECDEWERPAIFIIIESSRAAGERNHRQWAKTFSSCPSRTDMPSFLATRRQTRGSAPCFFSGQAGKRRPARYRFVHCTLHSVVYFFRLACVVCYRGAPRRLEKQANKRTSAKPRFLRTDSDWWGQKVGSLMTSSFKQTILLMSLLCHNGTRWNFPSFFFFLKGSVSEILMRTRWESFILCSCSSHKGILCTACHWAGYLESLKRKWYNAPAL